MRRPSKRPKSPGSTASAGPDRVRGDTGQSASADRRGGPRRFADTAFNRCWGNEPDSGVDREPAAARPRGQDSGEARGAVKPPSRAGGRWRWWSLDGVWPRRRQGPPLRSGPTGRPAAGLDPGFSAVGLQGRARRRRSGRWIESDGLWPGLRRRVQRKSLHGQNRSRTPAGVARQSEGTTRPPVAWDQARAHQRRRDDDGHGPSAGQAR